MTPPETAPASWTLAPASTAAPFWRRVRSQARLEAAVTLRNGEHLLLSLVLPLLALVGLATTEVLDLGGSTGQRRIDLATAGVMALALMSTAFTGQAITTGFDRRQGVLRMLATTPLGRSGLVAGKVLAVLAVQVVQLTVLGVVAAFLGWRPEPAGLFPAAVMVLVGTAAFTALGLVLAGTLRAEAVLAAANLVWVLLAAGGGLLVAADSLPGPLGTIAPWLPSGALGDGLRAALVEGRFDAVAAAVLAGWAVAAAAAVSRWFRWS